MVQKNIKKLMNLEIMFFVEEKIINEKQENCGLMLVK